jgi:hypothetical protein
VTDGSLSEAEPTRGPLWRRITAGVLVALAILAIILAPIMLYVRAQLLDSKAFGRRAENALASPAVQSYVTDQLTTNMVAQGGPRAQVAEPLIHAVVGGIVSSDRFRTAFGKAAEALQSRLLSGHAGKRLLQLQNVINKAAAAVSVVRPELGARLRHASGRIQVARGTVGKRLAQVAHRAHQLRVLGIVLPIIAFVLLALAIIVTPDHLKGARRAGWALIASGIVVAAVVGLTHRIILAYISDQELRVAAGDAENAFLGDLRTWAAWVVGIGVVVLGTAIFLESPRTLREHLARGWAGVTSRPAGAWQVVWRVLAIALVILLVIFAFDAMVRITVGVGLGLLAAYGIAELLRLAGVGAQRGDAGAQPGSAAP